MGSRLTAASLAVLLVSLTLVAGAGAAMIGIYRNGMDTAAQRSQLVKLSGRSCLRGGANVALRIEIGRRTKECAYRTPVIGRDLEIAAAERVLSDTPKSLQRKVFLAVQLRAGGGARYQLAVYPLQRKAQLRKVLADGTIRYLAIVKNESAIRGIDEANKLRLSAIDVEAGQARLLASVGGKPIADVTDTTAGELSGRASGFSVGAATGATGAVAGVDDVVIRVPSPF
jgi:hypothetical protein